ncbi:MAG: T9SS type A sorting domain-containing protein, partial [bacterium]
VGSAIFNLQSDSLSGIVVGYRPAPCIIDLDSDGLLDMIVGEQDGDLHHYEQDAVGSTGFTLLSDSLSGIDVGDYSAPSFTDLDSDGLLDMVAGENMGYLIHYEQDAVGSTSFTLISDALNEIHVSSAKPIFADINGDGLEDLIVGDYYGGVHYFQRDQDVGIKSDFISGSNALSFQLFPNYPNPFNPLTTIRYDLSKSVNVNVSIYNLLGQRIKVLENGFQQAGSYAVQWYGKNNQELSLSSGIYICRIQAGEFGQSIKLMLLK